MVSERRSRSYAAVVTAGGGSSPETPESTENTPDPIALPNLNMEDYSNPLYLHINENPNAVLVSPPLSNSNYHSWSRSMRMALRMKNKLGFIDGTITAPAEDQPHYAAWDRCNTVVCSWLLKSVSQSIAQSVLWIDHAKEIWEDLKERFSQGDPHRISDLQDEISYLKQGIRSITDYYTQFKILCDEMNVVRPLPSCSCGAIAEIRKYRDEDYVIRFVKGLNEEFSNIKSSVLLMDPIPSIFKMVIRL